MPPELMFTMSTQLLWRTAHSYKHLPHHIISYTSTSPGVYFYNSNRNHIIESTFNKVIINVQSYSALFADRCTFMNSSRATIITGRDTYSSVTLNNSTFLNNYADRNGNVYSYTRCAHKQQLPL